MRTILAVLCFTAAVGCANLREVQQVDVVEVQVIKIDTVFRRPDHMKQLTWKDSDEMRYISYAKLYDNTYTVGSTIYIMKKR